MKNLNYYFGFLVLVFSVASCSTRTLEEQKEFYEVSYDFEAPEDWQTYSYANDAFSIQVPPYMVENWDPYMGKVNPNNEPVEVGDGMTVTFRPNKQLPGYDNYSRIIIRYGHTFPGEVALNGDFFRSQDVEPFCRQLIANEIGDGEVLKVNYCRYNICKDVNCIDACYQRRSNTEGTSPVTCHIFFIQNYDEVVNMIVSYHDEDSVAYKDLFNIIETFKWEKKHIKFNEKVI